MATRAFISYMDRSRLPMFLKVVFGGLGTEDEEKERFGLTISGY